MTALLVALGGAVGAVLRFLADRSIQHRHDSPFPWGTFTVNVAGSLVLGFLAGAALFGDFLPGPAHTLVGTGFCGALTTFSTFGYETVRLFSDGAHRYALANIIASVLSATAAATAGLLLATALSP